MGRSLPRVGRDREPEGLGDLLRQGDLHSDRVFWGWLRGAVLTLERKSWDKGDCWNAGQVLERSSGWLKVGVRTLLERC